MVALALGAVGSAVGGALAPGFALGGLTAASLGGTIGQAVGGVVDSWLLAPAGSDVEGPRLSDLRVNLSGEGVTVNRVFGQARVPGNVIWATDLQEKRRKRSSGKGGGGGSTTTYSYSASLAVGVCEGPILGLKRIWADGKLFWEAGQEKNDDRIAIYAGTETQNPDAHVEAHEGAGAVPAWRGLAYVVFKDIPLADYGNRLPNFSFEVMADGESYAHRIGEAHFHSFAEQPMVFRRSAAEMVLVGWQDAVTPGEISLVVQRLDVRQGLPVVIGEIGSAALDVGAVLGCTADLAPDDRHVMISVIGNDGVDDRLYVAVADLATGAMGAVTELPLGAAGLMSTGAVAWMNEHEALLRVADADGVDAARNGVAVIARTGLIPVLRDGVSQCFGDATVPEPGSGFDLLRLSHAHMAVLRRDGDDLQVRVLLGEQAVLGGVQSLPGMFTGAGSRVEGCVLSLGGAAWVMQALRDDGASQIAGFVLGGDVPLSVTNAVTVLSGLLAGEAGMAVVSDDNGTALRLLGSYGGGYQLAGVAADGGSWLVDFADTPVDGAHVVEDTPQMLALVGDNLFVCGAARATCLRSGITGQDASLAEIGAAVLGRAGLLPTEMNLSALDGLSVTGYVIDRPSSARRVLEPLLAFGPHDLVESGGAIVARGYGDEPVWQVVAADEQTRAAGAAVKPTQIERLPVSDLPREVTVSHQDPARDYQTATQRAARQGSGAGATGRRDVSLPVVASPAVMKQLAENELYAAWTRREKLVASLPREALQLEPGDVIARDGSLWRVTLVRLAGQRVDIEALPLDTGMGFSAAAVDDSLFVPAGVSLEQRPALMVLELPPLPGFADAAGHVAGVIAGDSFGGGVVMRALDHVNFSDQGAIVTPMTAGVVLEPPVAGHAIAFDEAATFRVRLASGELESRPREDVLNGANAALIGGEVIQFRQAVEVAAGEWELSGLLRGRAGTEAAISGHVAGETFALLEPDALIKLGYDAALLGQDFSYRLDRVGAYDPAAGIVRATATGACLLPLAPVHGRIVRDAGGDALISWVRRTRSNGHWSGFGGLEGAEVPLGEAVEAYRVDVLNGVGEVLRVIECSEPQASYTAAQQVADFGSVPALLDLRIRQVSAVVGPGKALLISG